MSLTFESLPNFGLESIQIGFVQCALDSKSEPWDVESGVLGRHLNPRLGWALYLRFGAPEFWYHYSRSYVSYSIYTFASEGIPSVIFGSFFKHWTLTRIVASSLNELLFHPFNVGHTHYLARPDKFRSTLDAVVQIWRSCPLYLWVGLPAALLADVASTIITSELIPRIADRANERRPYSILSMVTNATLTLALLTPFRVVAVQAMSQTPLLRDGPFSSYPLSIIDHVRSIWERDGILGFWRGAPLLVINTIGRVFVRSQLFESYFRRRESYATAPWQPALPIILCAVSFAAHFAKRTPVKSSTSHLG
jgi:hypothetical protein